MCFVENVRVSHERTQAGFCAEQDRSSEMFSARVEGRVSLAEDASAQGDELILSGFEFCCHWLVNVWESPQ